MSNASFPPSPHDALTPDLLAGVLRSHAEIEEGIAALARLGLAPHPDRSKNWDTSRAIRLIASCPRDWRVLDVGCLRSPILDWAYQLSFRALEGCDLGGIQPFSPWQRILRRLTGRPVYRLSLQDLQHTSYPARSFDVITSISVIEHGVGLEAYFAEMARLLRPGGYLLTSTDYWQTPLTQSPPVVTEFGPMRVFCAEDLARMFQIAHDQGLELLASFDPSSPEPLVSWYGVEYTFAYFALRHAG